MNSRTDRLSDYVAASKKVAKRQIQVEQAVQRAATSPAADLVDRAQLGLESANSKLDSAREEFKKSQIVVTRELLRYEKDKAKEWQTTVQGYAAKQLMYEKEKLEALEKSWGLIQDLRSESEQRAEAARTGGPVSSGPKDHEARQKSYWPSGLGSPYAPELDKDDEEPRTTQEDLSSSSPKQPVILEETTPETRFPPNYGSNSAYNNGYNSGPNSGYSSGYNSGDQDEGSRSTGYFPATKLSRSGSGPRNKSSEPDLARKISSSRKGSIAGMASIVPTPTMASTPLGPMDPVLNDPLVEEDKNKDGYDPLMVRPGFTD